MPIISMITTCSLPKELANAGTQTVSQDAFIKFSAQMGYEAQQGLSGFISCSVEEHCEGHENDN